MFMSCVAGLRRVLLILLPACGGEVLQVFDHSHDHKNIPDSPAAPAKDLMTIAAEVTQFANDHGWPTSHMKHAKLVYDTAALTRYEKENGYQVGSVLGVAGCWDYTVHCIAIFRNDLPSMPGYEKIVVHEVLHLLGFGHEHCQPRYDAACQGVMGPVSNYWPEDTSLDNSYLQSLDYEAPKQDSIGG